MAQATNTTLGEIKLAGDLAGSTDANSPQLTATGITAGSYTFPTMTVDGKGRITDIHSGSSTEVASLIPGATKSKKGIVQVGDNIEVTSTQTQGYTQFSFSPALTGSTETSLQYDPCRPYTATVTSNNGAVTLAITAAVGGSLTVDALITAVNAALGSVGTLVLVGGALRLTPGSTTGAGSYISVTSDCLFKYITGYTGVTSDIGQDSSTIWVKEASTSEFGVVKVGAGLAVSAGTLSLDASTAAKASDSSFGVVKTGAGIIANVGVISVDSAYVSANLPAATDSTLGAVKTGITLTNTNGIIDLNPGALTVPTATNSVLGGVIVGQNLSVDGAGVITAVYPTATISSLGAVKTDAATITNTSGTISIPKATASTFGIVKPSGYISATAGVLTMTAGLATNSTEGIVKIGAGLTVTSGVVSFDTSTLPIATASTLGVVKIGSGLSIDGAGSLSLNTASLGDATTSVKGVVQIGSGLSVTAGVVSFNAGSLADATTTSKGVVQIGSGLSVTAGVVSIPDATTSTKGLVQVAAGLSVTNGVISAPDATTLTKGIVQVGSGLSINSGVISAPDATTSTKGIVQIGSGLNISAGVVSLNVGNGLATLEGPNVFTGINTLTKTLIPISSSTFAFDCAAYPFSHLYTAGNGSYQITSTIFMDDIINRPAVGQVASYLIYADVFTGSLTFHSNWRFRDAVSTVGLRTLISFFVIGGDSNIYAEVRRY